MSAQGERGHDRDLAFLGVRLRLADDLPDPLFLGVLVDQRDGGAEFDGLARQFRHVDDLGAREPVLKLGDPALVERLQFFCGVILGVLQQVAVRARVE